MATSVFSVVKTPAQAATIVRDLKAAGVREQDISVLFPDKGGSSEFAQEHHTKAPEGTAAGASAGGVAGGTLGLLAGIGALAIPGVGPLIAAGPIMAALSGAAVGATIGGITGALIGMGIPEHEAKGYEEQVKSGNILMSVRTDDAHETVRVEEIFRQGAGDRIARAEGTGDSYRKV